MLKMTKMPMVMIAQLSILRVVLSNNMIIDDVIIVYYKSRSVQVGENFGGCSKIFESMCGFRREIAHNDYDHKTIQIST